MLRKTRYHYWIFRYRLNRWLDEAVGELRHTDFSADSKKDWHRATITRFRPAPYLDYPQWSAYALSKPKAIAKCILKRIFRLPDSLGS